MSWLAREWLVSWQMTSPATLLWWPRWGRRNRWLERRVWSWAPQWYPRSRQYSLRVLSTRASKSACRLVICPVPQHNQLMRMIEWGYQNNSWIFSISDCCLNFKVALYKLGQQIPVSIYILLFELQCSNKDNSELSHQDLRVHTDNKIKWVSLLICQIFSVSFP